MKDRPRLAFVDAMKCSGMFLIVLGHVSAVTDRLLPPIYPKQLGVAFFLFVSGFTLARETRPGVRVVYNRLFEIYLFGVLVALLVTGVNYRRSSRLALSNFLPFFLGANVAFDNFPANPTTWFIGTYTHALIVWALVLRRFEVRPWMIVATAAAEVVVRASLADTFGLFVAYMALPNWASVFLLGLYEGRDRGRLPRGGPAPYLAALFLALAVWPVVIRGLNPVDSFPFMRLAVGGGPASIWPASVAVTAVMLLATWLTYQVGLRLQPSRVLTFFARNTTIIFIAHMPLFYALQDPLSELTDRGWLRSVLQFAAGFPGLALVSEGVRRVVRPEVWRERLAARVRVVLRRQAVPGVIAAGDQRPIAEGDGGGVIGVGKLERGSARGDDTRG